MKVCLREVALTILVSMTASLIAASTQDAVRYELTSESWFGAVCELCSCPDTVAELRGTFLLRETSDVDGFQTFEVLEVRWATRSSAGEARVTGSGTYRRGGPSGRRQQLKLDLRVGGEETHFTSGLVESEVMFPRLAIQVETSLKPICRDTVYYIAAEPQLSD